MICLSGASKIYEKSHVRALDRLSLRVPRGGFVSIVGASGSGKSTLMHLLGLLDTPSSGRYLLDGQDVSTLSPAARSALRGRKIGFIFQDFGLVDGLNARENAALPLLFQGVPAAERRRRAERALAAVGLLTRAEHTPAALSGGQRQRVAIARALITMPAVLLADEPTGSLDPAAAADVLTLLEARHRAGDTIVLITHDPAAARRADRRYALQRGRLTPL